MPAQERRLARVREPGHRGVGEQLQPQLDLGLLGRPPRPRRSAASAGSASRSARCRGRPAAARERRRARPAARGRRSARPRRRRPASRPERASSIVVAVGAVLARAAAGLAAAGPELRLRPERGEVAQIGSATSDDVAAAAAVTAVGPALRDVLLAPEAQASVAAAARQHLDAGAIVEHASSLVTPVTARPWRRGLQSVRLGVGGLGDRDEALLAATCGTRPCPRAWRRSCRRGRCPCRRRGGTACRAGGR